MDDIKSILNVIAPHLILKREIVILLLEYLVHRGSGVRMKTSDRDNEIFDAISALNQNARYRRDTQ